MLTYIFIFCAKIIEVSLMTIRTVLITRGEKLYGAIIGFVEVSIWLYVVSKVLIGIDKDPIKMVVYAFGFTCGNYIGCILEEKLALGILTFNAIASEKDGEELAQMLRNQQVGVTMIEAEGLKEDKKMLIIHVKRKRKNEIINLIQSSDIKAVVSIMDTKTVYGGYGVRK